MMAQVFKQLLIYNKKIVSVAMHWHLASIIHNKSSSYQQNNSGIAPKNCATSQKLNKQKNSPGKMMLFQDDHNHQESPLEALGMQVSGMSWNGNQQVRD